MGLTFIRATVAGAKGRKRSLRFLVDSGASYTVLPLKVWKALGLRSKRSLTFTLADGTELHRDVAECLVRYNGLEAHTPVVLGEPGDQPLLGVLTLEILGLVLNPFTRTLQPMKLMMALSMLTPR
jgi:clan AA aspartic protease